MKPGWMSTEFALCVALFVLVVLNGPLELGLSAQELISMAIAVAGYSGGRGLAKQQAPSQITGVVTPTAPPTEGR
jgi:hypothetical protein